MPLFSVKVDVTVHTDCAEENRVLQTLHRIEEKIDRLLEADTPGKAVGIRITPGIPREQPTP